MTSTVVGLNFELTCLLPKRESFARRWSVISSAAVGALVFSLFLSSTTGHLTVEVGPLRVRRPGLSRSSYPSSVNQKLALGHRSLLLPAANHFPSHGAPRFHRQDQQQFSPKSILALPVAMLTLFIRGFRSRSAHSPALPPLTWRTTSAVGVEDWEAFVTAAGGEWGGFLVESDPGGEPTPLPDHVVPGANLEWGVVMHNWQVQTCAAAKGYALETVQRRFYPTQGCEVDATTVYDRKVRQLSRSDPSLRYRADGTYSAGPIPSKDGSSTVEMCVVRPDNRQRVRLTLGLDADCNVMAVTHVMEWWEGPFNPDGSLPTSCGGTHQPLTPVPTSAPPVFVPLLGGVSFRVARDATGLPTVTLRWNTEERHIEYTRSFESSVPSSSL